MNFTLLPSSSFLNHSSSGIIVSPQQSSELSHSLCIRDRSSTPKRKSLLHRLCKMGLHRVYLDDIMSACCIRTLRKNSATQHAPASREKWQSHGLQGPRE